MKTSFISNQAMQNAMRLTISRGQNEVQKLQTEIVTGRHADVGLALGARTSNSVTLNHNVERLKGVQDSNSLVTQRLSASQLALDLMADSAQQMLEAFISVNGADDADRLAIARRDVEASLGSFTVAANTSSNGEYLFSGINSSQKPLDDYFGPGSPAKAAFDTTFSTHFGFTQSDPQVANISVADMDDFITNVLEPAFSGADWNSNWSSASDTNMSSRILDNEVVDSGTNANSAGMRNFALAAVIGLELLAAPISSEVRVALNAGAIEYAGQAVTGIDNQRSTLGLSENRVTKANVSLQSQIEILTLHLGDIEGVDAYEASTRMQTLLTQVETSYTLTARIQQLSLMNYL
ncbi:flagellar hook-associated family protein [Hoeflea ulvae]|uniref:Flagellin n=1 Tax=Hoeflea ulvae TaxID=2983764 RepID=A0ABT3YCB5_9HYPH|nr:flagellar hook-associated family protein [Hoeflea ulvae]MCY0093532.1 flagellar hook-associated family protein [Hoeflea ulvae]